MRRLVVAVLAAGVLALTGCTSSTDSAGSDDPSGQLDGTLLDRAPTEPTPPAPEQSEAGAIAYADHVFAVIEYAYGTADPAPLEQITDPDTCFGCEAIVAEITAAAQDGRVLIGPTATTTSDPQVVDQSADRATVQLLVQRPALVSLQSDSGEPTGDNLAAVDAPMQVTMEWDGSSWTLVDLAPIGN